MKEKKINRRSFVKNTTISSGALLTVPFSLEAMANSSNNKKLKLAVVGCGGRGTGAVVQALRADKDVELVAMADAFLDKVEKSLKSIVNELEGEIKINVKEKNRFHGFDAYKKAIELADVVILATPPGFRPLHFEYAIENDKHVFMEKPVATDSSGIRRVLKSGKLAQEKKLNVVVGLQRRYQNSYLSLFDKVKKGDVGKIISGQVYWNGAGVWVRKREAGQSEMEYQMRNWYYFNWLCGDHICEQHVHNIDVANWFLDMLPESAYGVGGKQNRVVGQPSEIYDHHAVNFSYPNGVRIASQCRQFPGGQNRVNEEFQGTKGFVKIGEITDYSGKVLWKYDGPDKSKSKDAGGSTNPYQVEHNELQAAIRNDTPLNNAYYGATSTFSAVLGRTATYSGKPQEYEKLLAADYNLMPDNLTWDSTPPVVPDKDGNYSLPMPATYKLAKKMTS